MNVMGKILVILNLVFAVIVGGFLVVDFATRKNWADAYKKLQDELAVARANMDVTPQTFSNLDTKNKKLTQELQTARQEVTDRLDEINAKEKAHKFALDAADLRAKDADLAKEKLLGENERLQKESQTHLLVIKARDQEIINQQALIVKYRNSAVTEESARKAQEARLEQALTRISELTNALAKASAPGGAAAAGEGKVVYGKANPPPVFVEGQIDSIHTEDRELVQINVGSDKGLAKNQTLEVFRVESKLYLGLIRIVSVQPHNAVGRLERVSTANRTPLKVGDTVATSLTRN
jgi:hypothetical protein